MGTSSYVGPILNEEPELLIRAPLSGWLDRITAVPDAAFADGMMGDGLMIDPIESMLVAPCEADVLAVAPTRHSITLRTCIGAELLIHLGIDTVALGGRGFEMLVVAGDKVMTGQSLIRCDLDLVARSGRSLRTPIVVINDGFFVVDRTGPRLVTTGDAIFTVRGIPARKDGPGGEPGHQSARVILPLAHGMHARPSARLATIARGWPLRSSVSLRGRSANAQSVAELMALGAVLGDELTVSAIGAQAAEAVAALATAISDGLGEQAVAGALQVLQTSPRRPIALDGSERLRGVTGSAGAVIGYVLQIGSGDQPFAHVAGTPEAERALLTLALERAALRLRALGGDSEGERPSILDAHLALLEDPALIDRSVSEIAGGASAPAAWRSSCRAVAESLAKLDNARLRERADDLIDVERQVIAAMAGDERSSLPLAANTIIVADMLVPTEMLDFAARGAVAFCTVGGGATSHLSILAAGLRLPVLAAMDSRVTLIPDGTTVILDGGRSELHVAPRADQQESFSALVAVKREAHDAALALAQTPALTQDGTRIEVLVNLGSADGAKAAMLAGAEGCGLLRSEFLFLDRASSPDEDEQWHQYQKVADAMPGAPLVIRTLDIGGDKPVPFLVIPPEENPALGLRGLRLSLRHPELLRTQLRAILLVKGPARVQFMLPMVIDLSEIIAAREILDEVVADMGVAASFGVMVETPASALLADTLAPHVDFFSIGTNDLTQYALAIDRANVPLAAQVDGLHPAVLRLMRGCCDAAAQANRPVGVCGSLAGDPLAVPILLGLGAARLSVSVGRIAAIKAAVRSLSLTECRDFSSHVVTLATAEEVRAAVRRNWPDLDKWV